MQSRNAATAAFLVLNRALFMIEAVRTMVGGSWLDSARMQARSAPAATLGMGLAMLAVVLLFLQSLSRILSGEINDAFLLALIGGTAGFVATTLGALPALVL